VLVGVLVAVLDAGIGGANGDRATAGLEAEAGIDGAGKRGRGEARIDEAKLSGLLGDDRSTGGELAAVPEAGVSDGSRGEQGESTGTESEGADHLRSPPWQSDGAPQPSCDGHAGQDRDAARPHTNHGMRQPGVKKRVAVGS